MSTIPFPTVAKFSVNQPSRPMMARARCSSPCMPHPASNASSPSMRVASACSPGNALSGKLTSGLDPVDLVEEYCTLLPVTVLAVLCCALGLHLFRKRAGEMVDEL